MSLRGEKVIRSLLVNKCFDKVAKISSIQNKWITAEAWFDLIKKEVQNCTLTEINLRWFKSYLLNSGRFIQNSNFPSPDGYYARERKTRLEGMTAQKSITCFLVTGIAGKQPPVTSQDWTESIITAVIPSHVSTQSGIHSSYQLQWTPNYFSNKRKRLHQASDPPSASSRPQHTPPNRPQITTQPSAHPISNTPSLSIPTNTTTNCPQANLLPTLNASQQSDTMRPISTVQTPHESLPPSPFLVQDYWHSTEAKNLFGLVGATNEESDIRHIMHERLIKFKKAILTCDGWKHLMEDEDIKNKCHHSFIFGIRKKCKYLYHAVNFALKEKGKNLLTWRQICKKAVICIKNHEDNDDLPESIFPKSTWITSKTVMQWFHQFKTNNESFINYPHRSSQLDKSPPFLSKSIIQTKVSITCP